MQYPKRSQYNNAKKKKYPIRNWQAYTEALRRRGGLTVWFDVDAIEEWQADKTGKPGGQRKYADVAIETGLVVRMIYKLAYRQTQGLLKSIATLLGLGHAAGHAAPPPVDAWAPRPWRNSFVTTT